MKRSHIAVGVAGIALIAASCGGSDNTSTQSAPVSVSPSAAAAAQPPSSAAAASSPVAESTATEPPTASPAPVATSATESSIAVPEALQFTAPAVGGGAIDAASFAGKPTVFWFWAPT